PVRAVDEELAGTGHVGPLPSIDAVRREDLQAAVLAVRDIYGSVLVHGQAVGHVKLARPAPRLSPGAKEPAVGRAAVDAGVAVDVADVEIARGAHGQIGRVMEGGAGAPDRAVINARGAGVGGPATNPERQEQPAVGREGANGVVKIVGAVDGVVRTDEDAMGP